MWVYQPIKKYKTSKAVIIKNNMRRKNFLNAYFVPKYY